MNAVSIVPLIKNKNYGAAIILQAKYVNRKALCTYMLNDKNFNLVNT